MSRFLLSRAARADLDEIWDFTAERWSVEQAERYIRQLDACQALADKRLEGSRQLGWRWIVLLAASRHR